MLNPRTRAITSRQNRQLKQLRATTQRSGNTELIALEGEHLVLEAIRSRLALVALFVVHGHEARVPWRTLPPDFEVFALSQELLASAVTTESPQPIAALALAPQRTQASVLGNCTPLVVVAAGLQDPGNLGTLIRSAEAFGATGMLLLPGTVSPWNSKALRASAGSALRLPLIHSEEAAMAVFLRQAGVRILAAVASEDASLLASCNLKQPTAMLIGNEGAGLSPALIAMADERITIPYPGKTESLNAAVAGSVLLYEAARQRGLA